MSNKNPSPPSFLGIDTSQEQALRIPFVSIGLPLLKRETNKQVRTAVILVRDISGAQPFKR